MVGGGRDGRCTVQGARMRRCDDATMLRAIERQRESVQKARPGPEALCSSKIVFHQCYYSSTIHSTTISSIIAGVCILAS